MTTQNRITQAVKAASIIIVSDEVLALFKEACLTQASITKANQRKESVGTSMLELAKKADSVKEFIEDCDRMERKHRASKCKDKTIPRCWTQAKSNIKAAMKMGLDVTDFSTEGALRTKLNKLRSEAKKKNEEANRDVLDILLAQVNVSFQGEDRIALANHLRQQVEAFIAPAQEQTAVA